MALWNINGGKEKSEMEIKQEGLIKEIKKITCAINKTSKLNLLFRKQQNQQTMCEKI